jgi:hypothetical protein
MSEPTDQEFEEIKEAVTEAAEAMGGRLMSDVELAGFMEASERAIAEADDKARAEGRRFLDEETDRDVIDAWYAEADKCETLEAAMDLMRRLLSDYRHDYGTIVHATTAAALAAAHAVSEGELTGFQAGFVFWGFAKRWMHWEDGPKRLTDYADLLYPQYDRKFTEIDAATLEWLQARAESLLAERGETADSRVVARWREIAAGRLPAFMHVEAVAR